jgi:nucleotide-binding universal stress UspA family protein
MSAEQPRGPALLCWDGSEAALSAIQHAADIVGHGHPALVLFAHVPTEAARGLLGGLSGPDAPIMGSADAEVLVERGVSAAREAGFDATGLQVVAERKTAEIIEETAEAHNAPLIVMGQRERSGLGKLLLGSVSRELLNSFHRPVLLIGPGAPGPYPRGG